VTETRPVLLYVDDEIDNLTVFEAAFEDDYTVHVASSAPDAIELLRHHAVDLVMTDQRMPRMTGVQFLEAITLEFPDVVRIVITGFSDVDAIIAAINTGRVYHYVTKPFDPPALKVVIDRALEARAVRRRTAALVRELEVRLEHEKRLRNAFQRFVPPAVVDGLLRNPHQSPTLSGELRVVSVLFAELAGFPSVVRATDPEEVVALLHTWAALCSEIVVRHEGIVVEFFGPGLLAVFGTPTARLDDDRHAIVAALALRDAMNDFRARWSSLGSLYLSAGLHRGEVLAGNIGSEGRMKYGVAGDTVNVAARLRAEASPSRDEVIVSHDAMQGVEDACSWEGSREVVLRGRTSPTRLAVAGVTSTLR
jgi:class 3 adenylate cyclase/CheY-like chemotaxis protein